MVLPREAVADSVLCGTHEGEFMCHLEAWGAGETLFLGVP